MDSIFRRGAIKRFNGMLLGTNKNEWKHTPLIKNVKLLYARKYPCSYWKLLSFYPAILGLWSSYMFP